MTTLIARIRIVVAVTALLLVAGLAVPTGAQQVNPTASSVNRPLSSCACARPRSVSGAPGHCPLDSQWRMRRIRRADNWLGVTASSARRAGR